MAVYKYKTKKGTRYLYKVCINGIQYLKRGFLTKKDAKTSENIFLAQNHNSRKTKIPLFNEAVISFLEHHKEIVKYSTYYTLEKNINKYIVGQIPNLRLDKINYAVLSTWRKHLASCPVKDKNFILRLLQRVFEYSEVFFGVDNKEPMKLNAFKNFSIKEKSKTIKFIEFEDFKKLMKVIDDAYFYLFFLLTFVTGLRMGEVRGLQVKRFSNDKLMIVAQAVTKTGLGKTVLTSLKTEDSQRIYALPRMLSNLLQHHILVNKLKADDFIFFSKNTKRDPISENTISRTLKKYGEDAGLEYNLHLHMFRHSEATILNESGVSPNVIAKYLGHSSSKITEKYYIDETAKQMSDLNELLEEKFSDFKK